jgi:hypothetical protein
MKTIQVVQAQPGEKAVIVQASNSLEALQGLVGGPIEGVMQAEFLPNGCHAYVHEEGKLKRLAPNLRHGYDIIVGPIVVSSCDGDGEEVGLMDHEADEAVKLLDRARGL